MLAGSGYERHRAAGARMDGRAEQRDGFAADFEAAFARLQVALETACMNDGTWAEGAIAAVRRGLEFAAAEPESASTLTSRALAEGPDGFGRYERLMSYLARLLEPGRAESPHGASLPATTERSLAGGVLTIVANRVDRDRAGELPELTAEVIQFVLTPYLGTEAARKIATAADWPGSQADR